MIVSALLTSVGINFCLCILFFTLYSLLRKQPGNFDVYRPRLLFERKSQRSSHFKIERILPTVGWVRRAWQPSEEELLSSSGLDAVVFMRIIIFSLRVFAFAGIIGVFVLLPINCSGDQLQDINFANLPNNSLAVFSISNVNSGSKRLWIHFCAVYIVSIFVCSLLYYEYKYVSSKRIAYFYSSKPQPHQFTILVRSIPVSGRSNIGDSVENFFKQYHPSTYLSHVVVHRSNLRVPIEVPAAFVSFKSRYGAASALHMQQSINPIQWVTEQAPEPTDVYWPFFSSSFMQRWISKLMVIVACILLTILFLIPVVIVQGLTNLIQLEVWFPFLKSMLTVKYVSQVITGYLPSLILLLFLKMIPPIMKLLSSIEGYISMSDIEKNACNKVLWFTIWNIFFANVLSGSVFNQIDVFLEPKNIPGKLAVLVPAQASFFITYVVTSGWTSISSELFRVFPFISSLIRKPFSRSTDNELEVSSFPYHEHIPRILFFGLLGIIYFFLAPLILPFLLIYFCMGYIIYRNQFINVYAPKYETGGKFWPIVHNSMIFSLVLMHAIAVGIFTLKKLRLASSLTFPLPILTLLFNEYCRKRFLPIFIDYSAECLIKKDREDCNDATMAQFYDKLITAYQDPALLPLRYSVSHNSLNSPLLSSGEA